MAVMRVKEGHGHTRPVISVHTRAQDWVASVMGPHPDLPMPPMEYLF